MALSIVRGEMRSQSVASSSLSGNRCFGPLKRFHASPSDQGSASVSICGLHVSADTGSRITRIDWTGPERPWGGEGVGPPLVLSALPTRTHFTFSLFLNVIFF